MERNKEYHEKGRRILYESFPHKKLYLPLLLSGAVLLSLLMPRRQSGEASAWNARYYNALAVSASIQASGVLHAALSYTDAELFRRYLDNCLSRIEKGLQTDIMLLGFYDLAKESSADIRQLIFCREEQNSRFHLYLTGYPGTGKTPEHLYTASVSYGAPYIIDITDIDSNGETDILFAAGYHQSRLDIQLWLQLDGDFITVNDSGIGDLSSAAAYGKIGQLYSSFPAAIPEFVTEEECLEAIDMMNQIRELEQSFVTFEEDIDITADIEAGLKQILFGGRRSGAEDLFLDSLRTVQHYTSIRKPTGMDAAITYTSPYRDFAITCAQISLPQNRYSEAVINRWFLEHAKALREEMYYFYGYNIEDGSGNFKTAEERAAEGFYFSQTLTAEHTDDAVLSFFEVNYSYGGGVHGFTSQQGYTFDLRTGELLDLFDIMADYDGFCGYVDRFMSFYTGQEGGMPLAGRLLTDDHSCTFYMAGQGITLLLESSNGNGYVEYCLPYEEIAAYMKPEYVPVSMEALIWIGTWDDSNGQRGLYLDVNRDNAVDYMCCVKEGESLYVTINGTITRFSPADDGAASYSGYTLDDYTPVRLYRNEKGESWLAVEIHSPSGHDSVPAADAEPPDVQYATLLYSLTNNTLQFEQAISGGLDAFTGVEGLSGR